MLQRFRYRLVVEWSDEDACYIARAPALPGVGAHGATPEKAAREAVIAYSAILDVLREDQQPIPPEDIAARYSGQLRLRLPRTLHAQLARRASAEGVSLNQELVALLAQADASQRARQPRASRATTRSGSARPHVAAKRVRKPRGNTSTP